MTALRALLVALALAAAAPAAAVQPGEMLADPAQEARARELSKGLRCLVCRNESIDDSNADLARTLRLLVRERIVAGDSDDQAIDYIVARYGEYVLLAPRFTAANALIWLSGPALLLIGGFVAWRFMRGAAAPRTVEAPPLTEDEKRRLADLLGR